MFEDQSIAGPWFAGVCHMVPNCVMSLIARVAGLPVVGRHATTAKPLPRICADAGKAVQQSATKVASVPAARAKVLLDALRPDRNVFMEIPNASMFLIDADLKKDLRLRAVCPRENVVADTAFCVSNCHRIHEIG